MKKGLNESNIMIIQGLAIFIKKYHTHEPRTTIFVVLGFNLSYPHKNEASVWSSEVAIHINKNLSPAT